MFVDPIKPPKSQRKKKRTEMLIRKGFRILVSILPGIFVAAFVFSANVYYDLDQGTGTVVIQNDANLSNTTASHLTVSDLTASRLIASDANKALVSTDLSSWIQGTTNQITVTDNGDGTITLSTPQDIGTSSSPTFSGLTLSSLTQGSVLFVGSSGEITEDNSNLSWDDTNNRLGIGTASPEAKLEVNGNVLTDDVILNDWQLGSPTYTSIYDWVNTTQSAGKISGGDITDNGDGTVKVSAGTGFIKTSNSDVAPTKFFDWAEKSSLSLTDNSTNYIYVEYNSGSPQVVASTTPPTDRNTNVLLGLVYKDGTDLHIVTAGQVISNYVKHTFWKDLEINGKFQRVDGIIISETGTRNIAITSGSVYAGLTKKTFPAFDSSGTDTFTYYYRDGSGGWTKVTGQTQIDNLHYDDGSGTLAELSNQTGWRKYYGVHWVYADPDGNVFVVYGQGNYTLTEAENAQPPATVPDIIKDIGGLIGKIIIEKNADSFERIESAFDTFFIPHAVVNHNELAGLQGGTTDEYYHLTADEHSFVSSVSLASPTAGQILKYDGTNWVNTSELFIDSSGNVGIGTTDPDRKLDILDSSNPQLRLTHTDGSVYSEFQTDSNGDLTITTTGDEIFIDDHLKFSTDNTYDIGASSANRPRTIYVGTSVVTGNTTTLTTDSLTASGALTISSGGTQPLTLDSGSGTLVLGAGTNTITNTDSSTDLTIDPTGNLIIKGSTSDNTTAALNVQDSSGTSLLYVRNDGNVGIGTDEPDTLLHLYEEVSSAAGHPVDILTIEAYASSGTLEGYGPAVVFKDPGIGTIVSDMARIASVYVSEGSDLDSALVFYTNDGTGLEEVMRIDNKGNVGIGTTDPSTRLDVTGLTISTDADGTIMSANFTGSLTKDDTNAYTFSGVQIKPTFNTGSSNTSTTFNILNIDSTNTSTTGLTVNLIKASYGGTEKFKVDSSGNLNISGNLTVPGTTTFNGVTYTWPSSAGSSGQYLTTDGSGSLSWTTAETGQWGDAGDYLYPLDNSGQESVVLGGTTTSDAEVYLTWNGDSWFTGGNVGIGTTGPDRKLDILDASNPQVRLTQTDGSVYGELKVDSSGDITITPSGDEVFIPDDNLRICSGGACPSPSYSGTGNVQIEGALEVGGSITRGGNTVWDAGNDGSGSGLDADLLDGHDSSYFMTASCPSGWVKVTDRTCIMQNEANGGGTLNWFQASDYCHDHYNARLCSWSEWYNACANGLLNSATDDWEWVGDAAYSYGDAVVVGSGSCTGRGCNDAADYSRAFRCCK